MPRSITLSLAPWATDHNYIFSLCHLFSVCHFDNVNLYYCVLCYCVNVSLHNSVTTSLCHYITVSICYVVTIFCVMSPLFCYSLCHHNTVSLFFVSMYPYVLFIVSWNHCLIFNYVTAPLYNFVIFLCVTAPLCH